MHTLLNLRGNIPEFIHLSDGKMADVQVLDLLIPEPGSFYLMDRGYLDFARLYHLHQAHAFFVTRAKRGFNFTRRYSHEIDKSTGLQCDQTIVLTGFYPAKKYPECKALGFLDTYLVFSPPPQRTGFGVCLGGPAPVFYSRAAARSTVHCRRA